MINLLPRRRRRVPLRRLDPRNLHRQEELGHLDRQAPAHGPDPGLGSDVRVQLVLELGEVVGGEGLGGGELVEGEGQGRLGGVGEVDGGEGDAAGGDVGDVGEGLFGGVAGDFGLEGGGGVGDFLGEDGVAYDEAGVLAGGELGGWVWCVSFLVFWVKGEMMGV